MYKVLLSVSSMLAMALAMAGQTIVSPDGRLAVEVACHDGAPTYTVTLDGQTFVEPSHLGLATNIGDFTKGLKVGPVKLTQVKDNYTMRNAKKSAIDYVANEAVITFEQAGKPVMDVEMRVSDNNVAFRYKLLPQGDTKCAVVESEATAFLLPEGTTTFLCPQMLPMTGFARTAPSYESVYSFDAPMGSNGWGDGYVFPALFKNNDKGWILVSETGLDGTYCGSHIESVEDKGYKIAFPNPKEINGLASSTPGVTLPGYTPWRTITVGETLKPIAETTIALDVVQPKYAPSKDYEYSKGTWSWIIKMDSSCNFDEQKQYIDFAADMGWQTVLVDAHWDTQIGRDKMAELAKYGKEKGVDLYLWYNSNGYWNDAPQGPRGRMNVPRIRRDEMAWMQELGIRGIKVDFFGSDKQQMIQLYEDILSDANDYGLLVIFHGCTLPRGWDRMFPNFAAAEAVRASENLYFGQDECDREAQSATMHPICRNTVAAMDFGGSALNKYYNPTNEPGRGSKRMTSDVFALATAVLFQSPVQHFALAPNNLKDAPAWAIDFMKDVPTTWDDIEYIDGYPGKFLIMARRSGDKWYISAINADETPIKTKLQLPMISSGQTVDVYADDASLNGSLKSVKLDKKQQIEIFVPNNGGCLIVGGARD